jgi:protein-S-isoprenylcysteine O-methyltransferase Ste14
LHLGTVAQIVGLACLSPVWLGLGVAPAALLIALYRNRKEDRAHLQHFGPVFQTYYRQTWDLVDLAYWK